MRLGRVTFFLALATIGAWLFWHSFDAGYEASSGNAEATMLFPRILLGAWILLAAGAMLEAMWVATQKVEAWALDRLSVFVLMVGVYVLLVPKLGFLIASVAFSFLSLIAFGLRKPALLAVFGLLLPLSIWLLFTFAIQIGLPTSPWFDRF